MLQVNFDHCAIESTLTDYMSVWFNRCSHFKRCHNLPGRSLAPHYKISPQSPPPAHQGHSPPGFFSVQPPALRKKGLSRHRRMKNRSFSPHAVRLLNRAPLSCFPCSLRQMWLIYTNGRIVLVFDCNIWTFVYLWFTTTFLTDKLLFPSPVLCRKWLNKNKTFSPRSICQFSLRIWILFYFIIIIFFFYSYLVSLCKSHSERGRREAKYISDPFFLTLYWTRLSDKAAAY